MNHSIERQLRLNLAISMVVILLLLLIVTNISTRILLEGYITTKLDQDSKVILSAITFNPLEPKIRPNRINPIYNSIHSGHYYTVKIKNHIGKDWTLKSFSLQNQLLPMPNSDSATTLHNITGPNQDHLIVRVNTFQSDNKNITISIAEDMSLLKQHRQFFIVLFFITGIVGVLVILVFQRAIIRKVFKKLDTTRVELEEIEFGKINQLSETVPSEIFPLVKQYNQGLNLMKDRLNRSRKSLGNLTHALKTPLNVLIHQLDLLKSDSKNDQDIISLMNIQAERITQLTERELKRAGIAGIGSSNQRFDPHEECPVLIDVLRKAHQKEQLNVTLHINKNVTVFADREDMIELIGNLMDNAFKWAYSEISCNVSISDKVVSIIIEDDGKSGNTQDFHLLEKNSVRLDETMEGYGLGLAICKDIVKLYDGSISFSESNHLKGFKVTVKLPVNN